MVSRHMPSSALVGRAADCVDVPGVCRASRLIARVQPLLVLLHGAAYAKVCGQDWQNQSRAVRFKHMSMHACLVSRLRKVVNG